MYRESGSLVAQTARPGAAAGGFKDETLDSIANTANVAQFISFAPDLTQRFSRVRGFAPNHHFGSYRQGVRTLLSHAPDGTVNIRSFGPGVIESSDFVYGKDADVAAAKLRELAGRGLYTIVNETVDRNDGGVSGVALGDVIEFAPKDTPRCVDKGGTASFERSVGIELLRLVYGFKPCLDFPSDQRVEFSIHPIRRGLRNEHTIIWEIQRASAVSARPSWIWPNRFSRFIGDKAYGLLIAHILGVAVPWVTVIGRHVAPFSFGSRTGTGETWIRTSPAEQQPGRFTTKSHWCDPFKLMSTEDPSGRALSSVLAHEGVDAAFSGKLDTKEDGEIVIEGVAGKGDSYMIGERPPDILPGAVRERVTEVSRRIGRRLHPISMEWVCDESQVWVVQLHRRSIPTGSAGVFVPGKAEHYHRFEVKPGDVRPQLEALSKVLEELSSAGKNEGLILVGDVGSLSHFGDMLRKCGIPSHLEYKPVARQIALDLGQPDEQD